MFAVPSAPLKVRRVRHTHEDVNESVCRNLCAEFDRQNQVYCELYYYDGDVQRKYTYTLDELQSLNAVEHPVYGRVYNILGNRWFACNDLSVLARYSTFFCLARTPVDPRLSDLLGDTAILINLLCYTEDDVNYYSKPSLVLRMPINPCDTDDRFRLYKDRVRMEGFQFTVTE